LFASEALALSSYADCMLMAIYTAQKNNLNQIFNEMLIALKNAVKIGFSAIALNLNVQWVIIMIKLLQKRSALRLYRRLMDFIGANHLLHDCIWTGP
jgi:hypothetical protein